MCPLCQVASGKCGHLNKSLSLHLPVNQFEQVQFIQRFFSFQGDYIWIEPQSNREFDVAIGARVVAVEGRRIQVIDDDNRV